MLFAAPCFVGTLGVLCYQMDGVFHSTTPYPTCNHASKTVVSIPVCTVVGTARVDQSALPWRPDLPCCPLYGIALSTVFLTDAGASIAAFSRTMFVYSYQATCFLLHLVSLKPWSSAAILFLFRMNVGVRELRLSYTHLIGGIIPRLLNGMAKYLLTVCLQVLHLVP